MEWVLAVHKPSLVALTDPRLVLTTPKDGVIGLPDRPTVSFASVMGPPRCHEHWPLGSVIEHCGPRFWSQDWRAGWGGFVAGGRSFDDQGVCADWIDGRACRQVHGCPCLSGPGDLATAVQLIVDLVRADTGITDPDGHLPETVNNPGPRVDRRRHGRLCCWQLGWCRTGRNQPGDGIVLRLDDHHGPVERVAVQAPPAPAVARALARPRDAGQLRHGSNATTSSTSQRTIGSVYGLSVYLGGARCRVC